MVDPATRASLYWSQSRLHSSQGRFDLASQYARRVVSILDDSEHTTEAARALLLLAHIENDRGDAGVVLELVDRGLPAVVASGDRVEHALFELERARALLTLGRGDEAASVALGTIPALRAVRPQSAARGFAVAASVFRDLGDRERAIEIFELAAECFVSNDRHLDG